MNRPDETNEESARSRRPCLVDGCACKDARIVSRRRAAYFAARARVTGQTANRVIRGESGWYLPGSTHRDVVEPAVVMPGWPTWHLADLRVALANAE